MQTFLFYDLETSGLSKCFDQVLQFAAIRTDLALQEIERYQFLVKISPDVIPAPGAMLTHLLSVERLESEGIDEYQAISRIHQILNTPGTISLGYNSLGFDDEFLRFSFYRHLLPPYTHQFANGCSRMDIYPLTILYYLFEPTLLSWPIQDGSVSLKLDNLNDANQFAQGRAHDAMVDVEITLALASTLASCKDVWRYCMGFFNKKQEAMRLKQLTHAIETSRQSYPEAIMQLGKFGSRNQFQAPVILLGQHFHYKNQSIWLRLDEIDLSKCTLDNFQDYCWTVNKKAGEPGFVLPTKPRYLDKLKETQRKCFQENVKWLSLNPKILQAIRDYYLDYRYPTYPNIDPAARLYTEPFYSHQENAWAREFHANDCSAHLLQNAPSERVQGLAQRIIARDHLDTLTPSQQQKYLTYLAKLYAKTDNCSIIDFKNQERYHAQKAYIDIEEKAKENLQPEEKSCLEQLKQLVLQRTKQYESIPS